MAKNQLRHLTDLSHYPTCHIPYAARVARREKMGLVGLALILWLHLVSLYPVSCIPVSHIPYPVSQYPVSRVPVSRIPYPSIPYPAGYPNLYPVSLYPLSGAKQVCSEGS